MGRKWIAVKRSSDSELPAVRIEFDISEDLYEKLSEDIRKGIHFVDDPVAFKELNRYLNKHCKDHSVRIANEDKVRFLYDEINKYLHDIFDIESDCNYYFYLGLIDKEEDFLPLLKKYDSECYGEKIGDRKYIINGLVIEYDNKFLITNMYYDFNNPKYDICSHLLELVSFNICDLEEHYLRLKAFKEIIKKTFNSHKCYLFNITNEKGLNFHGICFNFSESLDIYPLDYEFALSLLFFSDFRVSSNYSDSDAQLIYQLKELFGIKSLEFFMSEDAKNYQSFDDIPVRQEIVQYIKEHMDTYESTDDPTLNKKIDYFSFLNSFSIFVKDKLNESPYGVFFDSIRAPLSCLYDICLYLYKYRLEHDDYYYNFLGDYAYDFSIKEYQNAFDEMLKNELDLENAAQLLCDSKKSLEPPHIEFFTNDAFKIKPLYEDIILETQGLDKDIIDFDYTNDDFASFLNKRNSSGNKSFRTSIILNHLHELIGFVCQCSIKDISQDVLDFLVAHKIKLICDDIILNTRNLDIGYDIYLSTIFGYEKYWHSFACETKDNEIPKIISLDDEDDALICKDGLIIKCRGYKDFYYSEESDDYNHYVMKLDNRVKGFADNALIKPRNVLIFYDGNMLDTIHFLDGYDDIWDGVIVCRDGVVSKVKINHLKDINSIETYYSGTHMQNQTLLSGLEAIRKNQIFTYVTCHQMQFINYCGMNSFLNSEATITMLNGKEIEEYLTSSLLDIDIFVSVVDPDFEAG